MKEAIRMDVSGKEARYRYLETVNWEGDWELIHGIPYNMPPAPLRIHQEVSGEIFFLLKNHLQDSGCRVYSAPTDVFLSEDDDYQNPDTVVQPDVFVVCNEDKLGDKGIYGAPDLVVEIISVSTAMKDRNIKRPVYQQQGVKELWIIDPVHPLVEHYDFINDVSASYFQDDSFASILFPNLVIKVADLLK